MVIILLNKIKITISFIFFLLILSVSLKAEFVKCRILDQIKDPSTQYQSGLKQIELWKGEVLNGSYKGKTLKIKNYIWSGEQNVYNLHIKKNDIIIADLFDQEHEISGYAAFHYRSRNLIIVLCIFAFIVIMVAQKKGAFAFLSLIVLYCIIIFLFIPLIKNGHSPVFLSVLLSLIGSGLTLVFILLNRIKFLSAFLGVLWGILFTIGLALFSFSFAKISGLFTTEGRALMLFSEQLNDFNLLSIKGLFIAGIVITSLGAVMDIASGVSSSLWEIHQSNPDLSFKQLFSHSLSVGKDVIGTMVNTLLFICFTQLIIYFLVFQIMKTPFIRYSNYEFIIITVLFGLISSISLIITVLFTILSGCFLIKVKHLKIIKVSTVILVFIIGLCITYNLQAWIQPPDYELHKHPITRMYQHKDKHHYLLGQITGEMIHENRVDVKILSSAFKGQIDKSSLLYHHNDIKEKSKVIVWMKKIKNKTRIMVVDHYKLDVVLLLIIIFTAFLLFIHIKTGLKIFLSLVLIIILMFGLYSFLIIKGVSIVLTTFITVLLMLISIIGCIAKNKKIFSISLLSCSIGVIITLMAGLIIGKMLKINGFSIESMQMLNYYNANFNQGLIHNVSFMIYSIIIIGALGALIDVVITIVSALNEISAVKPTVSFWELFSHGMSIGRDLTGTMINTLILAYTGFNLSRILMFSIDKGGLLQILNFEFISVEITRSIAGSLGFVLIIPVTSFIASAVLVKKIPQRFNKGLTTGATHTRSY